MWAYFQSIVTISGTADTREEAITEGTAHFGGEPFLIVEGFEVDAVASAVGSIDIDSVLEIMDEHASCGAMLDDYVFEANDRASAQRLLDELAQTWARACVSCNFAHLFTEEGAEQIIPSHGTEGR